jgi:serine/threonine protein phosphatase PrpC
VKHVEFSAASDAGLVRSHNEDSFALVPLGDGVVLAVADGVGGSRAGEVASDIATSTLVGLLTAGADEKEVDAQTLRHALEQANASILERWQESELQGMGTTMTAAFLSTRRLVYAHAGDSRLYLYRGGRLLRITHDHSVAEELVRQGSLPPEQAEVHPQRHVLTRYLGLLPFSCDEGAEDMQEGDIVLLCTDGLTDALAEARIEQEIEAGFDGLALRLVEAANAAGGPDNTTVVAVLVEGSTAGGTAQ